MPKAFGASADLIVNRLYNASLRRAPLGNRLGVSLAFRLRNERIEDLLLRRKSASIAADGGSPAGIVFTTPWLVNAALALRVPPPSWAVVLDLAPPLSPGWGATRLGSRLFPTQEAKDAVGLGGVVTGAPVFPPRKRQQEDVLCAKCSERTMALLMAGREGYASTPVLAKALFATPSLHVTVLAGKGERLYRVLKRMARDAAAHVEVKRFVDDVEDLMARHDVVITKPGTMTACEALVWGKPLILDAIAGLMPQEVGNARFVVRHDAGVLVRHPSQVPSALGEVLRSSKIAKALSTFHELAGAERIGKIIVRTIERGALA